MIDKSLHGEKLWGATEISCFLGVSVDTIYEWAKDPDIPIYKPGRYFALRSELIHWLKTKPPRH